MNAFRVLIVISLFTVLFMTGCDQSKTESARSVEAYLNALINNDTASLSNLSCPGWESSALLELDSFQGVEASLKDLDCQETGIEENFSMVVCQGKIVATYNQEDQEIDLNVRAYKVTQDNGEWRVCGYQ
jgi:hypothetical protein